MLDDEDGDKDAYIPELVEDMIEVIKSMRSDNDED
jgi:predicted site-specific integrase-resolvase